MKQLIRHTIDYLFQHTLAVVQLNTLFSIDRLVTCSFSFSLYFRPYYLKGPSKIPLQAGENTIGHTIMA